MGSLLPGWDERAPGVAPREFQDIKEEDEDEAQGYFAAYARLKKLHAEHGEPTSPVPIGRRASLTRRSMPGSASLGAAAGSSRDWGGPGTPTTGASGPLLQASRSLTRSETLAADRRSGGAAAPGGLQRMYSIPVTRSERGDVLAGLAAASGNSPTAGGLAPRTPSLDAYKTHRASDSGGTPVPNYQWWRHFDSAALNAQPDLPPSRERQPSFVPQAAPGQALHFHTEAPPPTAAAPHAGAAAAPDVRPSVIPAH